MVIQIKYLFCKKTGARERCRGVLRLPALFFLLLLLLSCPLQMNAALVLAGQEQQAPSESQLKAVYLYNFLNFVYWPSGKCDGPGLNPREIAVLGLFPLRDDLLALQAKLQKAGKPLSVIFLGPYKEGMDLSRCRLLFICDSEKGNFAKIIARVAGEPVLTVAETEEFVEAGGMIALISQQNKVRWAVNRLPAEEAGLRFNSRLLAMAIRVID